MGFHLGPLFFSFYGIIVMIGAIAAAWLSMVRAKQKGENGETVWDGLIWVLVGGVIGARIWHILTPPQSMVEIGFTTRYYLTHPLDAIATWKGGMGIPGGVIGGVLALYIFCRRRKLSFGMWLDIAAPGLALAQAIGRWGNFVNQELYGAPTNLPWAITIDPWHRLPGYEQYATYHPLFLYESLWNLMNMILLIWLGRRFADRLKPGDVFLVYLIVYPIGRFWLEFLRLDASQVVGVNANQVFVLVVAVLAGVALYLRHRRIKTQGSE
ncbi:MAG: prolipoprotein diacylglyceryl transferase [Chloroflexota bacterium]